MAIRELLRQALPAGARERIYSVELVRASWARAVGDELARRSEPEALRAGVLTVRVTDPSWGKMIYKLQDRILPKLNKELGGKLIRRINFTKRSRLKHPVPEPSRSRSVTGAEPPAAIVSAASKIAEPELRALVMKSAARYLEAQKNRRK